MKTILKIFLILTLLVAADAPSKFLKASYYADRFEGRRTASGEKYRKDSLTCASNIHSLGTKLKVTNLENDSTVVVTVNDRISNKYSNRIDLSRKAMSALNGIRNGIINIKIEQL